MRKLTKKALAMQFVELCETVPLKDISIKDFIEFAGISKQTFYNYFQDKADLMNYVYKIASQKIADDMFATFASLREGAVKMARCCVQNKKFYTQLARYETQNNFARYFTRHCEEVYKEKLIALHGKDIIDSKIKRVIHIYCVGVCTYFVEWILRDMKEPPECVADTIVACIPPCIKDLLEHRE